MGKYMKKGKITGDVAVMEFPQSGLGVRTRAKTLALALQQNPELSYLQLRSRRLEKPQFHPPPLPSPASKPTKSHKQGSKQGASSCSGSGKNLNSNKNQGQTQRAASRIRVDSVGSGSDGTAPFNCRSRRKNDNEKEVDEEKEGRTEEGGEGEGIFSELGSGSGPVNEINDGVGGIISDEVEASFGENNLVLEGNGRSTRESTPCSLIRDLDTIGMPLSGVRSSVNQRRVQESGQRIIPTSHEMDDFFASAEVQQQKLFMEKYNYDVVNDLPLPGRYEWMRINP